MPSSLLPTFLFKRITHHRIYSQDFWSFLNKSPRYSRQEKGEIIIMLFTLWSSWLLPPSWYPPWIRKDWQIPVLLAIFILCLRSKVFHNTVLPFTITSIITNIYLVFIVVTQSLSHVRLFDPIDFSALGSVSSPKVFSDSWPLSPWCYLTISSSAALFCFCLQSFPASGSFLTSQFFASGGQSIGVSASAAVLPMNIQDWFPLELTGWISLQSKGLSRVFSNTTIQKHLFFMVQPSLF